ncbi:MAG: hypothetical protein R6X33_18080 [Candidatus Brocadiia bacterium]
MATLSAVSPSGRQAGAFTFTAADPLGDDFVNNESELLLVRHTNGAGSSVTLTVTSTMQVDGEDVPDKQISIGPGENHLLGPFPRNIYNDVEGKVALSWSDATDIEVALIKP